MSFNKWKEYKIGDITTWKSGGTPRKNIASFWNGIIPWISAKSLTHNEVWDSDIKISKEGLESGSRLAPIDSILLLVRGSGLFNRLPVGIVTKPVAFNQDVKAIEVYKEKIRPRFFLYWMEGNKSHLFSKLEFTGIGAGKFDTDILKNLLIKVPSFKEQDLIIRLIKNIDDKININRSLKETLEAFAETLFKEWFVDFNFPGATGEMVENELGEIPKGWRVGTVGDLFELQRGFDLPSSIRTPGSYAVIAASGFNGYHGECKIKAPGITTGRSGVLGNVFFVQEDFWPLNTSLFIKSFKIAGPLFSLFILKNIDLKGMNGGSAVPTLNRNEVHKLKCILPAKSVIDGFEKVALSLFQKIKSNEVQNSTLTKLRNDLLPKLINGEIKLD